ncbi:MAG TPA: hypothetical protein VHD56_19945, partial [Tepidisphaeraceae bacterium]|nr:hypothetical protein [Tepidisphaeraceae bacterium]
ANGDNPGPTRSVTLIATPREAESIELACATGKPRLVLRSAGDDENVSSSGVRLAELRHGGPGADPFQVMPADYLKPVDSSSSPTTQPTPVMETRPFRRGRQVKIIRGGVETDTVIEEIASPIGGHWMTNVESQELQTTK